MKSRPTKQVRGALLVERVFQVTIEQLAEVGLARLSMPDIARRAGANKTTLYRRWPTREELVRDALAATVAKAELAAPTGDLREDLIALGLQLAALVASSQGKALLRLAFAEGQHSPLRQLARGGHGSAVVMSPVDLLVAQWPARLRKRESELRLAIFMIAGAILHREFVEAEPVTKVFVRRLVDLLMNGLS